MIGACKQPVLPVNPDGAHGALGNVVVDFDAAISEMEAQWVKMIPVGITPFGL